MSKLFLGNFHFEHELSEGRPIELPAHLNRLSAELSFAWLAIAEEGDVVYCPTFEDRSSQYPILTNRLPEVRFVRSLKDLPRDLEPHPWGWSKPVCDELNRAEFSFDAPDLDVVKTMNGRDFAADLEEEFGLRPDDCYRIANIDELERGIENVAKKHRQWVLKSRFGMSGRERMKGVGTDCDSALQNWAEKRLLRDGELFLEPWLEIVDEIGIQIEIPQFGDPILMAVTQLFSDERGAFLAARFDQCEERNSDWKRSIEIAFQTANRMQSLGYYGPLGIDAIKYKTDSGEILERPLLDVNARDTMGRLSLGLQRHLREGEQGFLIVQRNGFSEIDGLKDVRSFSLSPPSLNGLPVEHRFVVVCGKCVGSTPAAWSSRGAYGHNQ